VVIQTYFQMRNPFMTINYLLNNFKSGFSVIKIFRAVLTMSG